MSSHWRYPASQCGGRDGCTAWDGTAMGTLNGESIFGPGVGIAIGADAGTEEGTALGALFGAIRPADVLADGTTLGLFAGASNLVA
jgi:hypothetical protein